MSVTVGDIVHFRLKHRWTPALVIGVGSGGVFLDLVVFFVPGSDDKFLPPRWTTILNGQVQYLGVPPGVEPGMWKPKDEG